MTNLSFFDRLENPIVWNAKANPQFSLLPSWP